MGVCVWGVLVCVLDMCPASPCCDGGEKHGGSRCSKCSAAAGTYAGGYGGGQVVVFLAVTAGWAPPAPPVLGAHIRLGAFAASCNTNAGWFGPAHGGAFGPGRIWALPSAAIRDRGAQSASGGPCSGFRVRCDVLP